MSREPADQSHRKTTYRLSIAESAAGKETMMINREFVEHLERVQLNKFSAVMSWKDLQLLRQLPDRDNGWFWLADQSGASIRCWIKRHRATSFRQWFRRWINGEASASDGTYEAEMSSRCQTAGVSTPTVIASGKSLDKPWRVKSFIITQHVPGQQADHLLQQNPELLPEIIAPTARLIRRLHKAKLYHRDLYWCHVFIHRRLAGFTIAGSDAPHLNRSNNTIARSAGPEDPDVECHLIDLQRMKFAPWFSWRWQIKDLAQFLVSVPAAWTSADERAWFQEYFGGKPTFANRLTITLAKFRAWFYWLKDHRKSQLTLKQPTQVIAAKPASKTIESASSEAA